MCVYVCIYVCACMCVCVPVCLPLPCLTTKHSAHHTHTYSVKFSLVHCSALYFYYHTITAARTPQGHHPQLQYPQLQHLAKRSGFTRVSLPAYKCFPVFTNPSLMFINVPLCLKLFLIQLFATSILVIFFSENKIPRVVLFLASRRYSSECQIFYWG